MRIAVGADHAGFELKAVLAKHLADTGHQVIDHGTAAPQPDVDYPAFGAAVGRSVVGGEADCGICCCGTGIGIGIAANKIPGVRAATVHDVTTASLARRHNDANVICLGGRITGTAEALDAVDAFLAARFEGGRHQHRVDEVAALETRGASR